MDRSVPTKGNIDTTYYDQGTLDGARAALIRSGLSNVQADDAINALQNRGILLRERVPEACVDHACTHRWERDCDPGCRPAPLHASVSDAEPQVKVETGAATWSATSADLSIVWDENSDAVLQFRLLRSLRRRLEERAQDLQAAANRAHTSDSADAYRARAEGLRQAIEVVNTMIGGL